MYISQLPVIVLGIICSLFALFWYFWMLVKSFWLSCTCFSSSFVQIHCFPAYDLLATRYPFFLSRKEVFISAFSHPTPTFSRLFPFFSPQARVKVFTSPFVFPHTPSSFFSFFFFFLFMLLFLWVLFCFLFLSFLLFWAGSLSCSLSFALLLLLFYTWRPYWPSKTLSIFSK